MNSTKIANFEIGEINGELILTRNGQPQPCAFVPPVLLPHPSLQAQAVIHTKACGTNCQFFETSDNIVKLHCSKHEFFLQKDKEKSGINPAGGFQLIQP
jgi:hypothetical protein